MGPVKVQVPLVGLNSSALDSGPFLVLDPPTTRTLPFCSRVAVWRERSLFMGLVTAQEPEHGS